MHWYGKGEVADQRKVGHVTITASSPAEARSRLAIIDPAAAVALGAHHAPFVSNQCTPHLPIQLWGR